MKTNKNGVKLLTAVMAFAMVFVAGAVVLSDGSDAEPLNKAIVTAPTDESAEVIKSEVTVQKIIAAFESKDNVVVKDSFAIAQGQTLTIPEGKKLWVDGDVSKDNIIRMTVNGTLDIKGTVYINAGTNKASSGWANNGVIMITGDGKLFSTSADATTGASNGTMNAFFAVIGTGSANYKHMYTANLVEAVENSIEATHAGSTEPSKVVYSYGKTNVSGNVEIPKGMTLNVGGAYGAASEMTIVEGATITNNGTIANNGTIDNAGDSFTIVDGDNTVATVENGVLTLNNYN